MAGAGGAEGIFTRKASGLVRSFSWIDILFFNIMGCSLGSGLAFIVMSAASADPTGDPVLSILIYFVPSIFMALLFALYTAAMPRSGGDYIYISRTIHPSLGFVTNWVVVIVIIYSMGWWANLVATFALPPVFFIIGTNLGIPWLVQLGSQASSLMGIFIIGTIVLLAYALLTTFLRPVAYAKVQAALSIVGIISLVIGIGVLATTTPQQAVSTFNDFAAKAGTPENYYTQVLTDGGVSVPVTLIGTLAVWPVILAYYQWFIFPSTWVGGEIKKVGRNQIVGLIGAVVVGMGSLAVYIQLAYDRFGRDFINSAVSLYYYAPDKWLLWPMEPDAYMLSAILTNNVALLVILGIGMVIWASAMIPIGYYGASRCFLAWSFDRLIPDKLAEVHPRYHVPIKGVILTFVLAEISLVGYSLGPAFFSGMWIWVSITFMCVVLSIAGIIFPFVKKEVYKASPISKYKIAKVPFITICGIVSAIVNLQCMYYLFFHPGWNWSILNFASETILAVSFISGIVVFYGMRYYRKRKGVEVSLAYKEIPPE